MSKPKVLIVDDDPSVRRVVTRSLADFCELTEAEGGELALALMSDSRFDLVVSDVDMPYGDGPSLLKEAVELALATSSMFVFMSGDQSGFRVRKLLDAGVPVLPKPFYPDDLAAAVESRLSGLALTKLRQVATVVA